MTLMVKPVILISSCERDEANGFNQAQRDTWLQNCAADYKFLIGGAAHEYEEDDKLYLPCEDDYNSLPHKTRLGHLWAVEQGWDFVFQCFTDTYVNVSRLLASGYQNWHYSGCFPGEPVNVPVNPEPNRQGKYCYASGGPGYWTSRRAILEGMEEFEVGEYWAEDMWAGDAMGRAGFQGYHDPRYWFKGEGLDQTAISVHLSRGTNVYEAAWMRKAHITVRRPR